MTPRPPQRKHFEPGCHWHAATRTFHGSALWEEGWYGSKRWEYVMQFSSDFRYICGGSVSMHREATPMDGRWRVCWDSGETALIEIIAGEWSLMGADYRLDQTSEERPFFFWPSQTVPVKQRLAGVVDSEDAPRNPEGPACRLNNCLGCEPPDHSRIKSERAAAAAARDGFWAARAVLRPMASGSSRGRRACVLRGYALGEQFRAGIESRIDQLQSKMEFTPDLLDFCIKIPESLGKSGDEGGAGVVSLRAASGRRGRGASGG